MNLEDENNNLKKDIQVCPKRDRSRQLKDLNTPRL